MNETFEIIPRSGLSARIGQELFQRESKAQRRQVQILEAAIRVLAAHGPDETTYERIARECKVTRQLVFHYFPHRDDLFEKAALYICRHYQEQVITELERPSDAVARIETYVRSNLRWATESRDQAVFWIYLFHRSTNSERLRRVHETVSSMCRSRLVALIELGSEQRTLDCPAPESAALLVITLLTCAWVALVTEGGSEAFLEAIVQQGLILSGWKPPKKRS